MSKKSTCPGNGAALRDLDPAAATSLTEGERERADATLALILAVPRSLPDSEPGRSATVVRSGRRRTRSLVAAALLVAAAIVIAVATPTTLGGKSAFASWTATPSPLSPSREVAAVEACLAGVPMDPDETRMTIAERRGGWNYILLEGRGKADCLMPDSMVSGEETRADGFTGTYDPDPPKPVTPPRDRIYETESAQSTVTRKSLLPFLATDDWYCLVVGYAGSDITAITVHPPFGSDVEATLVDGRYAAWWPGGPVSGDNPANGEGWTYTVTLTDGTVRTVAARP